MTLPTTWNAIPMAGIGSLPVPTSEAAWHAAEICRLRSEAYLANHAARSYFWGAYFGQLDGIAFQPELLWAAALMHDLGLTANAPGFDCFEHVSASMAREVLRGHDWSEDRTEIVADAIILHMQPSVSQDETAEARLLDRGISLDVSGSRFTDIPPRLRDAVLERYPRLDFKRRFVLRLTEVAAERPTCAAALFMNEYGLAQRIDDTPWAE